MADDNQANKESLQKRLAELEAKRVELVAQTKVVIKEQKRIKAQLHALNAEKRTEQKNHLPRKLENLWISTRNFPNFAKSWTKKAIHCSLAKGYFTVLPNGTYSCQALPKFLFQKVRARPRHLPPVSYVSLGSQDRYYVRFGNGEWQCVGSDACIDEIEAASSPVHKISFGAHWESYFILFQDGSTVWHDLPLGLHNKLNGRQATLPVVEELCVGSQFAVNTRAEEKTEIPWFVRFTNGNWEARGLSEQMHDTLKLIAEEKGDVTHIEFGLRGSWFIRYNPATTQPVARSLVHSNVSNTAAETTTETSTEPSTEAPAETSTEPSEAPAETSVEDQSEEN